MPASGLDFYYIIAPEASANMLYNPSFEAASLGSTYTAVGATLARSSAAQRFGKYCMSVTPTSGTGDGFYTGSWTLTTSLPYTFSVWGLWANGVPYSVRFANTSGTLLGTATTFVGAGKWERKEVTYTPGTTTVRLYVTKNSSSSTAVFYVDALQLEQKAYSTTYIDGSQDGCSWNGVEHDSTSFRYSNYRGGGRKVLLSTYDAFVTEMTGVGTPPVEAIILPYGYAPGGIYQGTQVKPRTMTIGVSLSAGNIGSVNATDINEWHTNMEAVFDLIKPDLVEPQQPFILGYQHSGIDVEIPCVYSGGMDLQNERLKDISDIAFQLSCPDPYWREVTDSTQLLNNNEYHPYDIDGNIIWQRDRDGDWTALNPSGMSVGARVYCIYVDPYTGNIYIGGEFTSVNGVSATNVALYTLKTGVWSALGTGCNAAVRAIIQPPVGNLLVAGDFTTANGVTTRCIAQWTGATFAVVGQAAPFNTVPTPSIRVMAIEPLTGYVLIGGVFLNGTTGTPCNTDYFARITVSSSGVYAWDGTPLNPYGVYYAGTSSDGCVNDIKCFGRYIYVTGQFDQVANSVAMNTNGIGRLDTVDVINGNISPWDNLGTGMNATTSEGTNLAIDSNGIVYLAGNFSSINGVSITGLAKFDGYQWTAASNIATVTDNYGLATSSTSFYSQMFFTKADELIMNYISTRFSGGIRSGADATTQLVGSRQVSVLAVSQANPSGQGHYLAYNPINGNIFRSEATASNSCTFSTTTTVTNNGSANAFPIITVEIGNTSYSSPAYVSCIRNLTNGRALYFYRSFADYPIYGLIKREKITIDCRQGRASVVSSIRGNQFSLDPASQDQDFFLSPGTNIIEVLTGFTSTISATYAPITIDMFWKNTHWTFNGGHE